MKNQLNQKIQIGCSALHSLFNFYRISNRIKANEGFKNSIYKDQLGNQTIGYGHLVYSNDIFFVKKRYSKKILLRVFYNDLKKAISDFKKYYHYKNLPNSSQEVIIEMVFQLGIKKVLKFKKFNFYIKKKQLYLASLEMMKSRWYQQTPKRVDELISILLRSNVRIQKK